jgi:hypothetical protein
MGHTHLECGSREFDEDKLKWDEFLKADWDTWYGQGFSVSRGSGCGIGCGHGREASDASIGRPKGGRGRGESVPSWHHNALPYVDCTVCTADDMEDTSTSLIKLIDIEMHDRDSTEFGAKRRLLLEY